MKIKNLKIISLKWATLYILILIVTAFFLKNFAFFSSYINNFNDYIYLDSLKFSKKINLVSVFSKELIENNNLEWLDKLNILTLWKNFSLIDKELSSIKTFNYKTLFNIWNIYLLKSYYWFYKNTWDYIENIKNAIYYYEWSLLSAPSYARKKKILYNYNLSKFFLKISYVYFCDNMFIKMINKTKTIIKILENTLLVLKEQNKELKKWGYYKDLKQCINWLKADSNKNILLVYDNKSFFLKTQSWLIDSMIEFTNKEDICYQKKQIINEKYNKSLDWSIIYFKNFLDLQSKLLTIYKQADYLQMKMLCNKKNNISNKMSKLNKDMQKNFKNLSDLANKPKKRQNKQKWDKKNQYKKQKNNNKANKNDQKESNKSRIDKKFEEYTNYTIKRLEEQNKRYINKIIIERSSKDFNWKLYIEKLFKEFNWKKDYYYKEKKQTIWK